MRERWREGREKGKQEKKKKPGEEKLRLRVKELKSSKREETRGEEKRTFLRQRYRGAGRQANWGQRLGGAWSLVLVLIGRTSKRAKSSEQSNPSYLYFFFLLFLPLLEAWGILENVQSALRARSGESGNL